MGWNDRCEFSELVGKTLTEVKVTDDQIDFVCADGSEYRQQHSQDCCESVSIEDVAGDWADVIGSPILVAEEVTNAQNPPDAKPSTIEYQDSFTWSFYKLDTAKGGVTVRWYGASNGYYSETVDIERMRGPTSARTGEQHK